MRPAISLSLKTVLAASSLLGPLFAQEQVTKDGEKTVHWIVVRFRGKADEAGPPVLLYSNEKARRAGLAYLHREHSDRQALLPIGVMEEIVAVIRKANAEQPKLEEGASLVTRPYRFILGRDPGEDVLDFTTEAARNLFRTLVSDLSKSKARPVLVEFAVEHQLLEQPR
jgi:hypothetical protein